MRLFERLGTQSKRAIQRQRRHGKPVTYYIPQQRLLKRLAIETGLTEQEIMIQLQREWKAIHNQDRTSLSL